jgi:hypothetical protein
MSQVFTVEAENGTDAMKKAQVLKDAEYPEKMFISARWVFDPNTEKMVRVGR